MQNQEKSTSSNTFTMIKDVVLYQGGELWGLNNDDKILYAYVTDQYHSFLNSGKNFYKSQPQIAKELEMSRDRVIRSLKKLEVAGLIESKSIGNKGGTVKVYTVPELVEPFDKMVHMKTIASEVKGKTRTVKAKVGIVEQEKPKSTQFAVPTPLSGQPEVINEINKSLTIEEVMTNERCLWSISQGEIKRVNYLTGITVGDALEIYNNNETTSKLDDLLLFKFLVSSGVGDSIDNEARREIQENMIPI